MIDGRISRHVAAAEHEAEQLAIACDAFAAAARGGTPPDLDAMIDWLLTRERYLCRQFRRMTGLPASTAEPRPRAHCLTEALRRLPALRCRQKARLHPIVSCRQRYVDAVTRSLERLRDLRWELTAIRAGRLPAKRIAPVHGHGHPASREIPR